MNAITTSSPAWLNRRAFECEVTQRLEDDPPPIAAMMMLDLDNLKYINDTYGHDWGDHYIKAAGRAVSLTFQGSGLFARISGDEFLVFVDRRPDRASIDALFDAFRHSLETSELEAPDGRTLKVRASMGVAYYPQDAGDFARLREVRRLRHVHGEEQPQGRAVHVRGRELPREIVHPEQQGRARTACWRKASSAITSSLSWTPGRARWRPTRRSCARRSSRSPRPTGCSRSRGRSRSSTGWNTSRSSGRWRRMRGSLNRTASRCSSTASRRNGSPPTTSWHFKSATEIC